MPHAAHMTRRSPAEAVAHATGSDNHVSRGPDCEVFTGQKWGFGVPRTGFGIREGDGGSGPSLGLEGSAGGERCGFLIGGPGWWSVARQCVLWVCVDFENPRISQASFWRVSWSTLFTSQVHVIRHQANDSRLPSPGLTMPGLVFRLGNNPQHDQHDPLRKLNLSQLVNGYAIRLKNPGPTVNDLSKKGA